MRRILTGLLVFVTCLSFSMGTSKKVTGGPKVNLGIDILEASPLDVLKGKRVGLITNISGVNNQMESTIDVLMRIPEIKLVSLFGPEHGVRGTVYAGEKVADEKDPITGLPVYSLYGSRKTPTKEMFEEIDALLFDIQDIGSRSYTFISSMGACMKAAKENNKMFVVLDRPNPMNGMYVDGNIPTKYGSFVCYYPIPYCHGMTIGELAGLFNKEFDINCDLHVVKMGGWKREMTWRDTGLEWVPTSPHIPEETTVPFYNITGIIGELRLVNEGVGYTLPFKLMGASWINATEFAEKMNSYELPGIHFLPFYYSPYYAGFKKQHLQGVKIAITDYQTVEPLRAGFYLMYTLQKMYPQDFDFELAKKRMRMFQLVLGSKEMVEMIKKETHPEEIFQSWEKELNKFKKTRAKYLLY